MKTLRQRFHTPLHLLNLKGLMPMLNSRRLLGWVMLWVLGYGVGDLSVQAAVWPWNKVSQQRMEFNSGNATVIPPSIEGYQPLKPLNVSNTWWDAYGRDDLDAFVSSTILNNLELQAKEDELLALQQRVKKQFAKELPTATIGGSWVRQKNSKNLISPNLSQFSGGGPQVFSPGSTFSIYNLPLTLEYELDLFRKNRYATRAEGFRYEAEVLRMRDMELSLAEHATETALQSLTTDAMIQFARQRLVIQEELLHLERTRFDTGLDAEDDSLLRSKQVEAQRAILAQREREKKQYDHEAAYLAGASIQQFEWKNPSLESRQFITDISLAPLNSWLNIDANSLIRRPDVSLYEILLRASEMDVQVARRMFLPSFTLSAQVGLASTQLSQWFDWNSILASFGTSVAQQLFAGGSIKANLKEQKARYDEVGKRYRNQLLLAGRDVENAIAVLDETLKQSEAQRISLTASEKNLQLEKSRYSTGLVSYTSVLKHEDAVVVQQEAWVTSKLKALLAWNSLQRQLGGGFIQDAT
jgi:NodT family efflux transporter outer membrane factor (OMF) lipoprotein